MHKRKGSKKFQLFSKKYLTSGLESDIIVKLTAKRGSETVIENWTTKRKVQAYKYVRNRTRKFLREILLKQKVKSNQARISKIWDLLWEILDTKHSRVWSWLRMNAGGVHNTFKSNGVLLFDPFGVMTIELSGGRVSNAWATCPCVGNNSWKRLLIPHNPIVRHRTVGKDLSHKDGLASD